MKTLEEKGKKNAKRGGGVSSGTWMLAAPQRTTRHCHPLRDDLPQGLPPGACRDPPTLLQTHRQGPEVLHTGFVWASRQRPSLFQQVSVPRMQLGANVSAGPAITSSAAARSHRATALALLRKQGQPRRLRNGQLAASNS